MEHRCGSRKQIVNSVHVWTVTGLAAAGQLRDLSISGGYIESSLPVSLLARVGLQIKLPGVVNRGKAKLKTEGHVVRVGPDGFAVEWCEFAPPAIREVIRMARADQISATASDLRSGKSPQRALEGVANSIASSDRRSQLPR